MLFPTMEVEGVLMYNPNFLLMFLYILGEYDGAVDGGRQISVTATKHNKRCDNFREL